MGFAGGNLPPVAVVFGAQEWEEEVGRLAPAASSRVQAERARRQIEDKSARLTWRRCQSEGPGGTRLAGCRKLYIPLDREGPSAAPFGFVFQLVKSGQVLFWNFVAFGERHPVNPNTRTVYERAHKRLHGRYP